MAISQGILRNGYITEKNLTLVSLPDMVSLTLPHELLTRPLIWHSEDI
jgi:hypothetical protein